MTTNVNNPLTPIERSRYARPPQGTTPVPPVIEEKHPDGDPFMVKQLRSVGGVLTEVYDWIRMGEFTGEE